MNNIKRIVDADSLGTLDLDRMEGKNIIMAFKLAGTRLYILQADENCEDKHTEPKWTAKDEYSRAQIEHIDKLGNSYIENAMGCGYTMYKIDNRKLNSMIALMRDFVHNVVF